MVRSNTRIDFPPPEFADEDSGLLFVGGKLSIENLKNAYSRGIFPWPHDGYPMLWFSPPERGILDFADLHIPKRLQRVRNKHSFTFSWNKAFKQVMAGCAQVPRKDQDGTWITEEMKTAYLSFHQAGYAHSLECWEKDELVGGIYGIRIGNLFSGESMFGLRDNVSKLCLIELVYKLYSLGHVWMDIQMLTPVTESLGGRYITREAFLSRLDHYRS
jgi:leucyl/phenylalanyl-tRNA--protein transferase